ncbi:MAG: molybdenum cofactor guanylyltransferase [Firmicutes bacterium]|nr:molybdenum cofactor guanylyltransferase [Bacillota bacterium]
MTKPSPALSNTVQRRKDRFIKTFASRSGFVREQGIYEKLKGSGLVPTMLSAQDGTIETQYEEGTNFYEFFLAAGSDPAKQAACFELFFSWYRRYRELTNISIGETDFRDFIVQGDSLMCLDLEHCRPGSAEEDIARLACMLALYPKGYTGAGLDSAKLFVCVGSSFLDWHPETLAKAVPAAADSVEEQLGLRKHPGMALYLAAYFTTAGAVLAGGKSSRMHQDKRQLEVDGRTMLEASTSLVAAMPQRMVSVSKEEDVSFPGFETIHDEREDVGPLEGIVRCLRFSRQPWTLFLTCDMPLLTDKLLRLFLSYPKEDADVFLFEAGGRMQTFPLLLRTENAVRALQEALDQGERKVQDVLTKKLKVRKIRAEDYKDFAPRMLWNINTPEDYQEITK